MATVTIADGTLYRYGQLDNGQGAHDRQSTTSWAAPPSPRT